MPETSFPALSVHPRVGISLSASKTDDRFYFSHMVSWVGFGTKLCQFLRTFLRTYGADSVPQVPSVFMHKAMKKLTNGNEMFYMIFLFDIAVAIATSYSDTTAK